LEATGTNSAAYQAKFDNSSQSVAVVDKKTNSVVATIPVNSTTLPSGFSPANSAPPPDKDDDVKNTLPNQSSSTTGGPPAGWPR